MKKDYAAMDIATLITTRLKDISHYKTQKEVSEETGYQSRNVISILKAGGVKLSLDRVPAMAKALDLDLAVVMMPALRQYYDDSTIEAMRSAFCSTETDTERAIIGLARSNMNVNQTLSFKTRNRLKEAFEENQPVNHTAD